MAENHRMRLLEQIHDIREEYDKAQKNMTEHQPVLPSMLYMVWKELDSYHPEDAPHKAVYILAKCKTILDSIASDCALIEAMDEAQRRLDEYDRREAIRNG